MTEQILSVSPYFQPFYSCKWLTGEDVFYCGRKCSEKETIYLPHYIGTGKAENGCSYFFSLLFSLYFHLLGVLDILQLYFSRKDIPSSLPSPHHILLLSLLKKIIPKQCLYRDYSLLHSSNTAIHKKLHFEADLQRWHRGRLCLHNLSAYQAEPILWVSNIFLPWISSCIHQVLPDGGFLTLQLKKHCAAIFSFWKEKWPKTES